ncbi:MAG: bifunctional precorrin-2 dehydrogenase/sirohydrochlorin ferrochelatase [Hydrogenothermaceae bacterium]|nr:bifunctional precorrin-2 dehydrogenase/sirohydrochlorin ferrochelatase [Hydrogenothermaceae bacterium]
MSYMPIFLEVKDKKFLIVGGGRVATEKIKRILKFSYNITVISPEITEELESIIKENSLNYIKSPYTSDIIKDYDIIIVAVSDTNLQKVIYNDAKRENKLCNTVDVIGESDFIFPSVVKKGNLIVAFSTSGSSPALAKYLRVYFEQVIPGEVEQFLKEMEDLRNSLPKGKERQELFDKKAKEFFEKIFMKNL